jgi:hypothetical protein
MRQYLRRPTPTGPNTSFCADISVWIGHWLAFLLVFKMAVKIIDSVMGSSQFGRVKRQIRAIEATDIRMMKLFLGTYPSIDRLQLLNVGRQTIEKIVRRNDRLWVIFPND